jgi:hypothetical protein
MYYLLKPLRFDRLEFVHTYPGRLKMDFSRLITSACFYQRRDVRPATELLYLLQYSCTAAAR